ncbi:MAG: orotate phosphoribosyltransferase [bacterium]
MTDREKYLEELRVLLIDKSYEKKQVILASGKESDFYVDCRQVTLHGRGSVLVGKLIYEILKETDCQAVGGPTLGADPMVTAVSLTAALNGDDLPAFIIRKNDKQHGLQNRIEGLRNLQKKMKVAIVEDVVTTASSTIMAIEASEANNLEVKEVICLVDREEGGKEILSKKGYHLKSLFTKTSLLEGQKNS